MLSFSSHPSSFRTFIVESSRKQVSISSVGAGSGGARRPGRLLAAPWAGYRNRRRRSCRPARDWNRSSRPSTTTTRKSSPCSAVRPRSAGRAIPRCGPTSPIQRPRCFRLRADGIGPEVDLGSNDQLFWFWIKRSQPPAIYFCRHDQFATSRARQMIPIHPNWLIEALGTLNRSRVAVPGSVSRPAQSHSNPHGL